MTRALRCGFVIGLFSLFLSSAAQADATYSIWGLNAHIDVELIDTDGSVELIGGTGSWNPLEVVGDILTIDPDAPKLLDFSITMIGDAGSIILLNQAVDVGLGAFDEIIVNSVTMQNAIGTSFLTTSVDGQLFWFDAIPADPLNPVVATAVSNLTLSNSGGGEALEVPYYPFAINSLENGAINRSPDEITLGLASLPIAMFQTIDGKTLRVQAQITVMGTLMATHMPEPNTALMMGFAILGVGLRVRRCRTASNAAS
jgi:hypothetical protein